MLFQQRFSHSTSLLSRRLEAGYRRPADRLSTHASSGRGSPRNRAVTVPRPPKTDLSLPFQSPVSDSKQLLDKKQKEGAGMINNASKFPSHLGSIVTFIALSFPTLVGAEVIPKDTSRICQTDSAACRSLAVGVAKLSLEKRIERQIDPHRNTDLLCTEDDADCCPPELMPYCLEVQEGLISLAHQKLEYSSLSEFGGCLIDGLPCDWFGDLFCGSGQTWVSPYGCVSDHFWNPPCPLGWTSSDFGFGCIPPPPCPCGQRPNAKGLCIPENCVKSSQFGSCLPKLCPGPEIKFKVPISTETHLGRHVQRREVQLEAASQAREELLRSLKAVEEEIRTLENGDSKKND